MQRLMCLLFLALAAASLMMAQSERGTILGVVRDETGAAIPGAMVTAVNTATNLTWTQSTDARGEYQFSSLLPGSYRVQVEHRGFATQVVSGVTLQVNQVARVDVRLQVGEVVQRIEVAASAVLLSTDTSEIGHVVTNRQIVDLPLNGRDYLELARLAPGAIPSRVGGIPAQRGVTRAINFAGARDTSMSFLLDGADTNEASFQTPSVSPTPDAIQEFKVLGNSYSAEFGRGATQILTALKSGTNEIHGTLFEFLRNDKFAARNFFQPGATAPLKMNQFGATLGGPALLPRVYNGKDRTFFFVNYDGQRKQTAATGLGMVPTPAQLAGDFSAASDPRIFDPATYVAASRTRTQFPGNRIPASRFSPRGQKVVPLFPKPNYEGGFLGRNLAFNPNETSNYDQGNARGDHRFRPQDSLFVRYSISQAFRTNYGIAPMHGVLNDVAGQNGVVNWIHIVNPRILNEFRAVANRSKIYQLPDGSIGENPARDYFGFTNTTENKLTAYGLPQFTFSGYNALGPGSAVPLTALTHTYQYVNALTVTRRAHTIKIGADLRRTRLSQVVASNDRGAFTFTGQFTNLPNVANTGNAIADLLLGHPQSASAAVGDQLAHLYTQTYAVYFQDDMKLSSRLTLNLGVRYEYAAPWREKLNQLTIVDPAHPRGRLLIAGTNKAYVPGVGVTDSGGPIIRESILEPDRNNWAPRAGLAFRPFAKTVLRCGYGIFYDVQEGNEALLLRGNPPFFYIQSHASDPLVPTLSLDTLFPSARGPTGAIVPTSLDIASRSPYTQQWNFNVQRQLSRAMLVEVGYAGSKGTNLLRRSNFQQWENILVVDPARPTPLRDRVRYPDFSPNLVIGSDNFGSSTYHGLLAKVEKRMSHGLTFLASYTFSRAIDDASSSGNYTGTPSNPQCRCAFKAEKGLSAFHAQQRLVVSYTYELPVGRGRRFLNTGSVVQKLAGGWQLSGITVLSSGPVFTINTPGDNASIGAGAGSSNNQRPNLVGDPWAGIDKSLPVQKRGVDAGTYYFNRAAFAMPPLYRLGNLGRNTFIGPGSQNWTLGIHKNTEMFERVRFQIRAEFFDFPNHPNFGIPGRIVNTPTFGIITWATGNRVVQFGAKLLF